MWSNKVGPLNENNDDVTDATAAAAATTTTTTTTTTNTKNEGDTNLLIQPSNNTIINGIVEQSTLALEVEILGNYEDQENTIYKLRGSTLDWVMLVDCDFGGLSKCLIFF